MTRPQAASLISQHFGGAQVQGDAPFVVTVPSEQWQLFARFAKDTLGCRFFSFSTAVDWKDQGLELVARIDNLDDGVSVLMKARLAPGVSECPSLVPVFRGADWMERECYDMLWNVSGTFDLGELRMMVSSNQLPLAGLSIITFCIYLGAMGKSAQFPLHVWLPDAMEGPTPVSALIHAATMVTAGVYLLHRTAWLFALTPDVLLIVAWIGAFTALLAAVLACVQDDIKRVLAYSTVSQLGYMGAFLVVETVARSEQSDSIDAYRGLAQRSPLLALAMLLFLLSLGGIPFVAGFWAKLYVFLAGVEQGLLGLVFVGAVLTVVALYYYLLVARRMYIEAPTHNGSVPVDLPLATAITVCLVGVIGIGVYPGPWVAAAQRIAQTLF